MVKPGDWQTHHLVAGGGPLPPLAAGAYAEPKTCNTSKRTKEPQGPMNDSPPKKKETKNPILSIDPPSTLPKDLSMPSNETSQGLWALKHKTAAFRATAAAFFSCSRSSSSFFRLALSSAKWSRPPFFSKACYFRNLWIWHLVTVRLQSSFIKIK